VRTELRRADKRVAFELELSSANTNPQTTTRCFPTIDNVTLDLDGVLYFRVVDPYKASYGVEDAEFSVAQLAQTTMRAEIGQMTLDRTLAERAHLNANIVEAINSAAADWGIKCLRYEIRDIHPPAKVVESMHQQVSAERTKRAQILDSEGENELSYWKMGKKATSNQAINMVPPCALAVSRFSPGCHQRCRGSQAVYHSSVRGRQGGTN